MVGYFRKVKGNIFSLILTFSELCPLFLLVRVAKDLSTVDHVKEPTFGFLIFLLFIFHLQFLILILNFFPFCLL